jgi:CRISPR-associated protein Cas2
VADRKPWIIAYDIAEPGRLRRVHKYLAKRAFALQYSVFAADLNARELAAIKRGLLKLIDEKRDDVRFYAAPLDLRLFGARRLPAGVYVFGRGAASLANGDVAGTQAQSGVSEAEDVDSPVKS